MHQHIQLQNRYLQLMWLPGRRMGRVQQQGAAVAVLAAAAAVPGVSRRRRSMQEASKQQWPRQQPKRVQPGQGCQWVRQSERRRLQVLLMGWLMPRDPVLGHMMLLTQSMHDVMQSIACT